MELDSLPACYVWNRYPQVVEFDSWSGQCSDGLGTGTVVYRFGNGDTMESPYVKGVLHGTEITRGADGDVVETPYVNGETHGTLIVRRANGDVSETPYVNSEIHGTRIQRYANGDVVEIPYVNSEIHGTVIERQADGEVTEEPYVNGKLHGTVTSRFADGRVVRDGICKWQLRIFGLRGWLRLMEYNGIVGCRASWIHGEQRNRHLTRVSGDCRFFLSSSMAAFRGSI